MMIDADLPAIKVVAHARARQMKLSVSAKGIRMTVPPYSSERQVKLFLEHAKVWLKNTWAKQQVILASQAEIELPQQLQLCYSDQCLSLEYLDLGKRLFVEDEQRQCLQLHQDAAPAALTEFVKAKAKQILPLKLHQYAQQHRLKVKQLRIATPKRRWGSCSVDQRIMLHAGLLLMPEPYADYVIMHELAHTREMNHQAGFWNLLEQIYPAAKQRQRELKQFILPSWWHTKPSKKA